MKHKTEFENFDSLVGKVLVVPRGQPTGVRLRYGRFSTSRFVLMFLMNWHHGWVENRTNRKPGPGVLNLTISVNVQPAAEQRSELSPRRGFRVRALGQVE
jgi:hypothetical protein